MKPIIPSTALSSLVAFRHPHLLASLACAALAMVCHPAAAAPGDLDLTFGGTGKVTTDVTYSYHSQEYDNAQSVLVQSDGKILVAGYSNSNFSMVRYNVDGSRDLYFGGAGYVITDSTGVTYAAALQSDGKIVLVGRSYSGSIYYFLVARYNTNGSLDTSFNGGGKVTTDFGSTTNEAFSVSVQADGKIVVAGYSLIAGNHDVALVRYNSGGSLDTSFNGTGRVTTDFGGTYDYGNSVVVQGDGRIVVAGRSEGRFALARYNANGTLDTSFNGSGKVTTNFGSGYATGSSMALQNDGKIVVAGSTHNGSDYDFAVARYNANGSLDTSFNGTGKLTTAIGIGDDVANSVAMQSDGRILVTGPSLIATNNTAFALVRYNANGSLDTSFNGTGKLTTDFSPTDRPNVEFAGLNPDSANSVAVQSDGRIVVAGTTFNTVTNTDFAVVRYEGFHLSVPESQTANLGAAVSFSVSLTGANALAYQWRKDGVEIPGATGSSYTIPNAQPWHIGEYTVAVTESNGTTTSGGALLQINDVPTGVWKGLIAYYPFNGDAVNKVATGGDGVVQSATLSPDRFRQTNSAYALNGSSSFIDFPSGFPIGGPFTQCTISLWFKAESLGPIFGDYRGSATAGDNIYTAEIQIDDNLIHGSLASNYLAVGSRNVPSLSTDHTLYVGDQTMIGGRWHSVVYTMDGAGSCVVYLDGVMKGVLPYSAALNYVQSPQWRAGNLLFAGQQQYFAGRIDDIRIYTRALSASEVQQLNAIEDPDTDGDSILDRFETGTGVYVSPEDTGTSSTNSDSDGDGLYDGQEVNFYTSNPNVRDTDGDGFDDGFEVTTGFSPTSAASTPDTLSTILTAVEYRFNAANGISYRIEASTDLASWTTVETNIIGAGGVITRFYSIEGQPRRFFRSRRN